VYPDEAEWEGGFVGGVYQIIDRLRTDCVHEMDRELQNEHYDENRRHPEWLKTQGESRKKPKARQIRHSAKQSFTPPHPLSIPPPPPSS